MITMHDMSDADDMTRQLRSFYARINFIIRNFNACSLEVKQLLFNTFCTNMYCAHLWCGYKKSNLQRLMVAYNNCFRKLLYLPRSCSASGMFASHCIPSFNELWRKGIFNFKKRLSSSTNSLVHKVLSFVMFKSSLWTHWYSILYVHAPKW